MAIANNLQEKVRAAKAAGYSDQQIQTFLQSKGLSPTALDAASASMEADRANSPLGIAKQTLANVRETVLPTPKSPDDALKQGLIPVKGPISGKDMYIDPLGATSLGRPARGIVDAVKGTATKAVTNVSGKVGAVKSNLVEKVTSSGVGQTVTEFAERVPRAVTRVKEAAQEAAQRAEKIKTSPPKVANAIKAGLDDRIINTIQQASPKTRSAYKEMVDISENAGDTLKVKERPEIVAGRAAEEQFKIIDKQKRTVGKQIGEAVDKLSKNTTVDMTDGLMAVDDVLGRQGVGVVRGQEGTQLNFSGSRFTPAERIKIQQLYDLATEGGRNLTPRQIYGKDQLFSKLQREARFEGIGDLIVETEEGNKSLFKVFKDMYAAKLDAASPDDIRALNKQYRQLAALTDDIENSIVKSGKYETTKNVADAEFAQTNLRRLLSDAQSAADYREIVAEMDRVSRSLGYDGPNAEELITFATELRKIYPEAIPPNSFGGSIRASVSGILDTVAELGAPDTKDKQKALRELLEEMIATQ